MYRVFSAFSFPGKALSTNLLCQVTRNLRIIELSKARNSEGGEGWRSHSPSWCIPFSSCGRAAVININHGVASRSSNPFHVSSLPPPFFDPNKEKEKKCSVTNIFLSCRGATKGEEDRRRCTLKSSFISFLRELPKELFVSSR